MTIARTDAAGGGSLLPEVLAFSSSLAMDRRLLKEDLLGSLAHLTMLRRTGIIPADSAQALKDGLCQLWDEEAQGKLQLPNEEDVHMAVEVELHKRIGDHAGLLHSARSRNDQVSLDLRLHVRQQCAEIMERLSRLIRYLADRAEAERDVVLPSYTHRQRAMPVSLGYYFSAYAQMFARDVEAFTFVLSSADVLPLGVGAIGGTSLPIDREMTRSSLRMAKISANGMDTVGDRDFALDYTYAAARLLLHASRLSADMVDFTTAEFGYARLDGTIAMGSSMMPQKRNPDVFELIRGKSGAGIGNLTQLLVTVKGLPAGYNRDLQEDRGPILATGELLAGVLSVLELALPKVTFDREKCQAAVEADAMQATDLAEALVKKGIPFRQAYKAVGALVRQCQERKLPLAQVTLEQAQAVDARFDAKVLEAAQAMGSVARKVSEGSTGLQSMERQVKELKEQAERALGSSRAVPRIDTLFTSLREVSL